MRWKAILVCVLMVCAMVRPAGAASLSSRDKAALKHYFEKATKHYQLGEFKDALEDYKAAYRIRRDGSFLYNIAQCFRQLKQWEESKREYEAFLRESPNTPKRPEVERLIAQMEDEIQRLKAQAAPTDVVQPAPEPTKPDKVIVAPGTPEPTRPGVEKVLVAAPEPGKPDVQKVIITPAPEPAAVEAPKSRWWIPVVVVAGALVVGGAITAGVLLSRPSNETATITF